MRISIGHVSRYTYSEVTNYAIMALRLTPPSFQGQRVVDWRIIAPGIDAARPFRDGFGNMVHLASCAGAQTESLVIAKGIVETEDCAGVVRGLAELAPLSVYRRQTAKTVANDDIRNLARMTNPAAGLRGMHDLMTAIREAIEYRTGATNSHTTAADALRDGAGVCQDHAHVFISAVRSLGIPARYVSGYLMMNDRIDQEAGHAWAEAHIDGLGWVGFDVSNGISPDARYVRVATGRDYAEAAPVTGMSWGAGESVLSVSLAVEQQLAEQ